MSHSQGRRPRRPSFLRGRIGRRRRRPYNAVVSDSIAIIDYGMANLRSVQKAFEQVSCGARIISRPEEIDAAEKIVLPGVGAFADAVVTLREKELAGPILRHIERGKPF